MTLSEWRRRYAPETMNEPSTVRRTKRSKRGREDELLTLLH